MSDVPTFGAWLRHRRKALDLTQAALAQQVGCSLGSIRKYEGDEQRPSRQLAELLATQLQIPSEERAAFVQFARLGLDAAPPMLPLSATTGLPAPPPTATHAPEPPQAPAVRTTRTQLPYPTTPLIGRVREIAEVGELLRRSQVRLLTLTGPGGTGKTRLAFAAAQELAGSFADGVCFVDLAPIQDAALVLSAIAQALGVREMPGTALTETLQASLRERQLLLLIDNFEQVLAAAPLLTPLRAACPQLRILVTSRACLHLSGEHEYPVPPLALPPLPIHSLRPGDQPAASWWRGEVEQYAAVQLFVVRAQAALPSFTLTDTNREVVAAICRRLDGLPLAIELAAARIKLLPPAALHDRLRDRLVLLTGGPRDLPARQQTLRATIDWSYSLLPSAEQGLFRCLAVFVGGWTLDAAEAVCGEAVLDGLQALLDQSLIQQDVGSEPRFRMLETIREYAQEQLQASAEHGTLRRQHGIYYGNAMRVLAYNEDQVYNDPTAHLQLDREFDNLRAALLWAIEQRETEIGLWLSSIGLGHRPAAPLHERLAWMETVLALDDAAAAHAPLAARAAAHYQAGWSAVLLGEYDRAHTHFLAYLALCQELADQPRIARAYRVLGWMLLARSSAAEASAALTQSLTLSRAIDDAEGSAWSQNDLGYQMFLHGELIQAEQLLTESLAHFRSQGSVHGIVSVCHSLGHLARAQGQDGLAARWYRECLIQQRSPSFVIGVLVSSVVESMTGLYAAQGRASEAARLLGAAAAIREHIGVLPVPHYRVYYERDVAAVRAKLGEEAFATAWERGHALTLEQAVAEALQLKV
jgi:predicted ATPase/transcriptional regulator with XRE-family HTH domain